MSGSLSTIGHSHVAYEKDGFSGIRNSFESLTSKDYYVDAASNKKFLTVLLPIPADRYSVRQSLLRVTRSMNKAAVCAITEVENLRVESALGQRIVEKSSFTRLRGNKPFSAFPMTFSFSKDQDAS